MAVVTSGKFNDLLTSRGGSGQSNGAHRRFGARIDEPEHFDFRHEFLNQFGKFDRLSRRHSETGSCRRRIGDRPQDVRVCMAVKQWTVGQHIVDVPFSIDVEQIRPFASFDKPRRATDRFERADG